MNVIDYRDPVKRGTGICIDPVRSHDAVEDRSHDGWKDGRLNIVDEETRERAAKSSAPSARPDRHREPAAP
jgi:hypothetical protein